MINLRIIEYESSKKPEEIRSVLNWAVEWVDSLFMILVTNNTGNSSRNWVGTMNKSGTRYKLVTPNSFFQTVLIRLVLVLDVEETVRGSLITLTFRPGWSTAIQFVWLFAISIASVTILLIDNSPSAEVFISAVAVILIVLVFVFLVRSKIRGLEERFERMLDLDQED